MALGFSVFAFSSFPPVVYFGLFSATVMLLALVANFVLTPALLSSFKLISLWDILSARRKAWVLERCALFQGMQKWQIKKFVLVSDVRRVRAGGFLRPRGRAPKELFVILNGTVEATRLLSDGSKYRLATFRAGDALGEIALVSEVPNPADLVALEDTDVLVLKWDHLRWLRQLHPHVCAHLFLNISAILGRRLGEENPAPESLVSPVPTNVVSLSHATDWKLAPYPVKPEAARKDPMTQPEPLAP